MIIWQYTKNTPHSILPSFRVSLLLVMVSRSTMKATPAFPDPGPETPWLELTRNELQSRNNVQPDIQDQIQNRLSEIEEAKTSCDIAWDWWMWSLVKEIWSSTTIQTLLLRRCFDVKVMGMGFHSDLWKFSQTSSNRSFVLLINIVHKKNIYKNIYNWMVVCQMSNVEYIANQNPSLYRCQMVTCILPTYK